MSSMIPTIIQAFLLSLATFFFYFAYRKRSELRFWFLSMIVLSIGAICEVFLTEIGSLFFAGGVFILCFAIFMEYYETFHKYKKTPITSKKVILCHPKPMKKSY